MPSILVTLTSSNTLTIELPTSTGESATLTLPTGRAELALRQILRAGASSPDTSRTIGHAFNALLLAQLLAQSDGTAKPLRHYAQGLRGSQVHRTIYDSTQLDL